MTLVLRLLGPVGISRDEGPVPAELFWRKNLALLIYLACSPPRGRTPAHLQQLLWPNGNTAQSLNQALVSLRKGVGEALHRGDLVRLDPGACRSDLERLTRLVSEARWTEAADLIGGEFCQGFELPGAPEFEDWVSHERRRWAQVCGQVYCSQGEECLARGSPDQAAESADRALAHDPYSEPALRLGMRALAHGDRRPAALERFQRFTETLRDALGAEPGPETVRLAERIRKLPWLPPAPRVRPGASQSRRAPLVGRAEGLSALVLAWAACRDDSRPTVAVVEGVSGTGRTRLADELLLRARLDGAAVVAVRLLEADRSVPSAGLMGLARGGLLEASGVAAADPAALGTLARTLPEWAARFAQAPESGLSLRAAFTEVIRASGGEQPLVLLLDDAEYVDAESLLGLAAILRDAGPVPILLLLTVGGRPNRVEIDQLRSRIGRDLAGVVTKLGPLGEDDMRQLAEWAIPGLSPDERDRLVRRVLADSAGLPLLAVELLHAVALGLDLGQLQGAWPAPNVTLTDTLPGDLPDSIVASLRVGFHRLGEPARRCLAALAVLGRRLTSDELGRLTGLAGVELAGALAELEWQRWVVADARGWSFLARLAALVVDRDMVLPAQRERLRALDREPP